MMRLGRTVLSFRAARGKIMAQQWECILQGGVLKVCLFIKTMNSYMYHNHSEIGAVYTGWGPQDS